MKHHPSDVWKCADIKDHKEMIVLLALADYGAKIYPSQTHLAAKCRMDRRTLQRTLNRLRLTGAVVTRKYGKALFYVINLTGHVRQADAGTCVTVTPDVRQGDAATCVTVTHKLTRELTTEPRAAITAEGGWSISDQVRERIQRWGRSPDFAAQERVCKRVLIQHGLTESDARWAWKTLTERWGDTGVDAYAILQSVVNELSGARDARALLIYKLKGAA